MIIKDAGITSQLLAIADHYNSNISTRFIRPLLTGILSEDEISRPLTALSEQSETYSLQGIHLDELYQQIVALSRFVFRVRTDILPNLRTLAGHSQQNDANKIYRDMALNNFGANIQILAELSYDLFGKTVDYDKSFGEKGRPVYRELPALQEVPRYLGFKEGLSPVGHI